MKIEHLLKSLETEIKANHNEVEKAEQLLRLQNIAKEYDGDDRVVSSEELFEEVKNAPQKRKFFSGFSTLDKLMDGFVAGESIFFTGITKHGKTSMCMELSTRFEAEHPVWLSFEEKSIDLLRKFYERTNVFPKFFTPRQNEIPTLEWVESKIVEAKAKYGSNVVFIDHIGFLADAEKGKDDTEASRYERISRAIHSFAVKWDVLIFLMGHLHQVRIDQQPDIQNIKGSTGMAQESDLTILLWRKTTREGGKVIISNETNLSLQANRRGQTGNIEFIYQNGRFLEEAWGFEEPTEEKWDK